MQYPLHLLNLKSVRDFDAKIDKDKDLRELDPRRFRANIIGELVFHHSMSTAVVLGFTIFYS